MPPQRCRHDFYVARASKRILAKLSLADAVLWQDAVLHCFRFGGNNRFRVEQAGDPRLWVIADQSHLVDMVHVHPPMVLP